MRPARPSMLKTGEGVKGSARWSSSHDWLGSTRLSETSHVTGNLVRY
jgi:hypothetical protein